VGVAQQVEHDVVSGARLGDAQHLRTGGDAALQHGEAGPVVLPYDQFPIQHHRQRQVTAQGLGDVGEVGAQQPAGTRPQLNRAVAAESDRPPTVLLQTSAVSGDSTLVYFHGLPSAQSQYAAPAYSWLPAGL